MTPAARGAAAARVAGFAALWVVMTGGAPGTWGVGVPAVLVAAWVSHRLQPGPLPWPPPGALVRLVAAYLAGTVQGAIEVAWLALRPAPPPPDGLVEIPLRLAHPAARVVLADILTLMPGSAAIELRDRTLLLHVLDRDAPIDRVVGRFERLVARVFGDPLADPA